MVFDVGRAADLPFKMRCRLSEATYKMITYCSFMSLLVLDQINGFLEIATLAAKTPFLAVGFG